jgi:hypothetical protein
VADAARLGPLLEAGEGVSAEAVFRVGTSPIIIFKSAEGSSDDDEAHWHRLAWNSGAAPLLWVTTPQYVRLYNAFAPPAEYASGQPMLKEFPLQFEGALDDIAEVCGRQHMAMGGFWRSPLARRIDRRERVDGVLLAELVHLLEKLVKTGLPASLAQKLVGRCIFFQYLVHRGYVSEADLAAHFGGSLSEILEDQERAYTLFRWLRGTFNGDLFPIEDEPTERARLGPDARCLQPLSDFFGRFSQDGQGRLFPFRFEAIPVELISSIYEKFVHLSETDGAPTEGVHYTPINLVDLVLDPVFEGLSPHARVLDPACGSGVFLVESLRRLVWLRAAGKRPSRKLLRDTLLSQVRGIDISPAALSVAAFSLYLALLELDPDPPSGFAELSRLRFPPLHERVLFAASAFEPGIEARLDADGPEPPRGFDVIVGNPPWTYRAVDRKDDRTLQRADAAEVSPEREQTPRSGTTYARLKKHPLPPRSPDWAFLWRAKDFATPKARVALLMKATPFFSLDPAALRARDAVLQVFDEIALVNLSQLRTERLFQEYEGADGRKPTAGPALIFIANCLPTPPGEVAVMNFPWSSTFARTGLFELPAEAPATLRLDRLRTFPFLLKATALGGERDAWLVERLWRSPHLQPLAEWLDAMALPFGQGYQPGPGKPAAHLIGLPVVEADALSGSRIADDLPSFSAKTAHRRRSPQIFKGPLVLLPEGRLSSGPVRGRYSAAFDARTLAFNESYVGISFSDRRGADLPKALAAVMHSALVVYQLAMCAGTLGVKQTKVEAVDLYRVLVPRLDTWPAKSLRELAGAYDTLTAPGATPLSRARALQVVDQRIASFCELSDVDCQLLVDIERRASAIMFETPRYRAPMEQTPTDDEVARYADNLCTIFNALATEPEDLALTPDAYRRVAGETMVLRFSLHPAGTAKAPWTLQGHDGLAWDDALRRLGLSQLPYLQPTKSLRIYADDIVFLVKPAHYRWFTPAAGQTDADRVVADLMSAGGGVEGAAH